MPLHTAKQKTNSPTLRRTGQQRRRTARSRFPQNAPSTLRALTEKAARLRKALQERLICSESPRDRIDAIHALDLVWLADHGGGERECSNATFASVLLDRAETLLNQPPATVASIWRANGQERPALTEKANEALKGLFGDTEAFLTLVKCHIAELRHHVVRLQRKRASVSEHAEGVALDTLIENLSKAAVVLDFVRRVAWNMSIPFFRWDGEDTEDVPEAAFQFVAKVVDAGGVYELLKSFGEKELSPGVAEVPSATALSQALGAAREALKGDPLFGAYEDEHGSES